MASKQPGAAGEEGRLHMDELVAALVPDPKAPPDALLLSGFVGDSSEEGHVRLYFDAEMRVYVDIPRDAVLYSRPLPEELSPFGGSYVWIRRDAELVQGKMGTERKKARFFEGPIMQELGGGAAGPAGGIGQAQPLITAASLCGFQCPSLWQPWCPPGSWPIWQCPPFSWHPWRCPSVIFQFCPPTIQGPICPVTLQGPNCPITIQGPNCPPTLPSPLCGFTSGGPACPVTLRGPGCELTTAVGPQCGGPSIVDGCPSTPAGCDFQSVACGGFQTAACGGFPGGGLGRQFGGQFKEAPAVTLWQPACQSVQQPCITQRPQLCPTLVAQFCPTVLQGNCPSIVQVCPVTAFGPGCGGQAMMGQGVIAQPLQTQFCNVQPIQSQLVLCASRLACPSWVDACPSQWVVQCPIQTVDFRYCGGGWQTFVCPSIVDACPSAPGLCDFQSVACNFQSVACGGFPGGFEGGGGLGRQFGGQAMLGQRMMGQPMQQGFWQIRSERIENCWPPQFQSQFTNCTMLPNCWTQQPNLCPVQTFDWNCGGGWQTQACPSNVDACPSAPGGCNLQTAFCGGFRSVNCGGFPGGGLGGNLGGMRGGFGR